MEATTVYNRICMNGPIFSPICLGGLGMGKYTQKNSACCCTCGPIRPAAAVIPAFACPSAPRSSNPFLETPVGAQFIGFPLPYWAGASDYTAVNCYCNGLSSAYNAAVSPNDPQRTGNCVTRFGVLNWDTVRTGVLPVAIEQIVDGTSTTLFCAELAGRPDLWHRGVKQPLTALVAPDALEPYRHPTLAGAGVASTTHGSIFSDRPLMERNRRRTNATVACFINCTNQLRLGLYSFHPGTCGLAMCDGSSHMVSENISIVVFCRLITYKGRSPVTDSF